jgi:hypothetical protein
MSKAYEYLKKNGYTQEFLKIFFVGVDDNQIFHFNPNREHVYMLRYDHEAIKEYQMFLKLR